MIIFCTFAVEIWQSGRSRRSWKPLYRNVSGVRIPLSPQESQSKESQSNAKYYATFFFKFSLKAFVFLFWNALHFATIVLLQVILINKVSLFNINLLFWHKQAGGRADNGNDRNEVIFWCRIFNLKKNRIFAGEMRDFGLLANRPKRHDASA